MELRRGDGFCHEIFTLLPKSTHGCLCTSHHILLKKETREREVLAPIMSVDIYKSLFQATLSPHKYTSLYQKMGGSGAHKGVGRPHHGLPWCFG